MFLVIDYDDFNYDTTPNIIYYLTIEHVFIHMLFLLHETTYLVLFLWYNYVEVIYYQN